MDEEKTEPTTSDFLNHDNDHEETDLNKQENSGYYVPQSPNKVSEPTTTTTTSEPKFSKDTWVNDKDLSKSDSAILSIVLNKDAKYTSAEINSAIKDFEGGF